MLAMTGVITSTTEKNSLITLLQDMEYIHGQLFERSVESGCGSVTCLPGALTMLRFSAFRKMAKYYFADKAEQCDDLFDYGKCHLGEDRWLTHLFMIGAKEKYQIQMCTGAFCKTEAVQTYRSLLKQRRRWFLGFITNEVCMLTDIRLWRRYPILCIVRFMQNTIRTTSLLFFIMVISIITTENKIQNLPVGFIAISLGLNWLLMLYFGLKLLRFKLWLYPIMFLINPFFNWIYMTYGIFTAGQRTWGGPRADAGAADVHISPQQAIEHAEATGDDLNVVPETFKPAIEARYPERQQGVISLFPSDHIEGRFAPAERLPGGWYLQNNDSGFTLPNMLLRNPNFPHVPLHPRSSFESSFTDISSGNSVYMPRRVEDLMGDEDRRKYLVAQHAQREYAGAHRPEYSYGRVFEVDHETDSSARSMDGEIDSINLDNQRAHSSQENSCSSGNSTRSRSPDSGHTERSISPSEIATASVAIITTPTIAHYRNNRPSTTLRDIRTTRSPLAGLPLTSTRITTGDEAGIELTEGQGQHGPPADDRPNEYSLEAKGVSGDSQVSVPRKQRNRLTKVPKRGSKP